MISKSKLSYLRIAPRKVRLVADLVRGEKVEEAQAILDYTKKRAALPILKLIRQAVANAKNNFLNLDEKNLYISKILVNEGPKYKRLFPRARGRGDIILKKTSHVIIELDSLDKKLEERKEKGKVAAKGEGVQEEKKEQENLKEREKQTGKKIRKKPFPGGSKSSPGQRRQQIFRRKAF